MDRYIPQSARRSAPALLLVALLAGCAVQPPVVPSGVADAPATTGACLAWFDAAEAMIARAGARDVQAARLPGAPHLRVDRLLAALAVERPEGAAYTAWLDRATALARAGWVVELANLSAEDRRRLAASTPEFSPEAKAMACIERLRALDMADAARAGEILDGARVADAYVDWQRVIGLYPLTRWPVLLGYQRWRDDIDARYRLPLAELPVTGELRRYATVAATLGRPTGEWSYDALGYPVIDQDQLVALFAAHSPVWEIDTVSEDDRPGTPYWAENAWRATVDTARLTLYRHLSFTRVAGEILPQLNYLVWFPARTPRREGDIYAGHLDGLLFRVTLGRDGEPLLYDTIHSCGCYHMFFPGPRLAARPDQDVGGEGFYVPQPAVLPGPGQRLALRLEAGTHQLLRLHAVPADLPAARLVAASYDDLRSLPSGTKRQSLFGPDGLVAGTGRSERYLLWPMGVPSAGAMRQWGHHATMFVGRRHFDDPGLVEAGFRLQPASLPAGG